MEPTHRAPPLTHLCHQIDLLLCRLNRIHMTASRMVVHLCEHEFGLARSEWRLLSFLSEREGALSSELAEHAMLDRARTSRTLTQLQRKRLIQRQAGSSNRREVRVFLTEEGRSLYRAFYPHVAAINHELASALSALESDQLDRIVLTLQGRVQLMVTTSRYAVPPISSGK